MQGSSLVCGDTLAERLSDESEQAYRAGDLARAVVLARDAAVTEPPTPQAYRRLAWILEIAGDLRGATDALLDLSSLAKLDATEEHALSFLLCRTKEFETAADHAAVSVALAPERMDFAKHAANLFGVVGRHIEAVQLNVAILRTEGEDAATYHRLSLACNQLANKDLSMQCAQRAHELDANELTYALALANLLVAESRYDEAISVLMSASVEIRRNSSTTFLISFSLAGLKRFEDALSAVEAGLVDNPHDLTLTMHRGSLFCCLKRYEEAAADFRDVLARDTDNDVAKRACFAALTEAGLDHEAVARGAELLAADPHDRDIGRSLQVVLGRRFSEFAASEGLTGLELYKRKRKAAAVRPAQIVQPRHPLLTQSHVIYELLLRDIATKFTRAKLGFLWAIFEPLAHIGIMLSIVSLFGHAKPPFGDSFAVFYFTGIIVYHMATHTASGLMHAIHGNASVLQIPMVTTLDVLISRSLTEFFTEICVAIVLLTVFLALGLDALPFEPMRALRGFLYIWATATGVGLLNVSIAAYLIAWEKLWGAFASVLYFASGTFYIPALMPVWVRDILIWNPILQAIELVRSGFFADHDPVWLNEAYLGEFALVSLFLGLAAERLARRRLLSH